MPERSACDEAIQFSQIRLKVPDQELMQGSVEMFNEQNIHGIVPRPWGMEGGFAVVYKFRTLSGKIRALRCFRVPMKADIQIRYECIGTYFSTHIPNIAAEFNYYPNGIVIREQALPGQPDKKAYPLIDMEWVEGITLLDRVEELCNKSDRAGLEQLTDRWVSLLETMRQAHVAHGDLAGGNIMVRPDGRLVLIDYDGVYIPDFAALGLSGIVQGQPDFQHHQMEQRPFNEHMDDFSALVIYTSLLALQIQPSLLKKNAPAQQTSQGKDGGILFSKRDFVNPERSLVFKKLENMGDVRLNAATQKLKQACQQTVAQVRFPLDIILSTRQQQALLKLKQALQIEDDEEIVQSWVSSLLDSYEPAQQYRKRVEHAREITQQLHHFRSVLQSGSIQKIVQAYKPALNGTKSIKIKERGVLELAREFEQATQDDDDQAIISVSDKVQKLNSGIATIIDFTQAEIQRIQLAQRREGAITAFRQALRSKNIRRIAAAYDQTLDNSKKIQQDERSLLQLAHTFIQAYDQNDNTQIVATSEAIQQSAYQAQLTFTPQEKQRIALAMQHELALERFNHALASKNIQMIVTAYDSILDTDQSIDHEKRQILSIAQEFMQAYSDNDDQALATASEEVARYQQHFALTIKEQQRVALAQQRKAALIKFRQALISKRAEQIVAAYDSILTDCKNIAQDEREQLSLARDLKQAYQQNDDSMLIEAWNNIQHSRYQKSFILHSNEQQRIALAQTNVEALQKFRDCLQKQGSKKNAQQIIANYDQVLDSNKDITAQERDLLRSAERFIHMYDLVLSAIQAGNEKLIGAVYEEELAQQFSGFTEQENERIQRALKHTDLEHALAHNDYGTAIRLAQEIAFRSRKPVLDDRLVQAKRMFIRNFDVKSVEALLTEEELIVRWAWPSDELVSFALVLWRYDDWPSHPKKNDPSTHRKLVTRHSRRPTNIEYIRVSQIWRAYIQVLFAIPDDTQQPPQWFYSNGETPGARKIVDLQ
jgi:hypothetical protein